MPSKYLGWTNYIKISTCVFVVGEFLQIFHSGCACGWVLGHEITHILGGSNIANLWRDQVNLSLILPYTPENMERKNGELVQMIFLFKAGWFSGSSRSFLQGAYIFSLVKNEVSGPAIRWKLPRIFCPWTSTCICRSTAVPIDWPGIWTPSALRTPLGKLEKTPRGCGNW